MDVSKALTRRRMIRSFDASPLDEELVTSLFDDALRAPTAGNCRGIEWVTLIGPQQTATYFDATTDEAWRARSSRFAGLSRASAIGICVANPAAYLRRYAAPDKASSGLGVSEADWPVPFWFGDAGASTMAALLLAEERELAAAFLGSFRGEEDLKGALGIPESYRVYGAILLGRPDDGDHRSSSLDRPGPTRSHRLHRGSFGDHA